MMDEMACLLCNSILAEACEFSRRVSTSHACNKASTY